VACRWQQQQQQKKLTLTDQEKISFVNVLTPMEMVERLIHAHYYIRYSGAGAASKMSSLVMHTT